MGLKNNLIKACETTYVYRGRRNIVTVIDDYGFVYIIGKKVSDIV